MEQIFKFIKPHTSLFDFVESFWRLHNQSENHKEIVVLADGRIDIAFGVVTQQ